MIAENRREFEELGIINWWNKDYKGQGIRIANFEKTPMLEFFEDKVILPFDYMLSDSINVHGQHTMSVIHQVAPEAIKYAVSHGTAYFEKDTIPFLLENKIHLVNASLGGSGSKDPQIKKCIDNGTIFSASAGNSGASARSLGNYAKSPMWFGIGAVHNPEKIVRAKYSSVGEELFAMCFSNIYVPDGRDESNSFPVIGTSFASPLFTGMLALVQQFFIEKTGRFLTYEGMDMFVRDNVVDYGKKGHDSYYGYGLFILPNPDTIDVDKYRSFLFGELVEQTPEIMPTPEEDESMVEFKDIKGRWSEDYINYMVEKGYMKGYEEGQPGPEDDLFRPDRPMTREEVAAVLARMDGFVKKK